MPSSGRHILDIAKKGPSRAKARGQMSPLFSPKMPRPPRLRQKRRTKRIIALCICLLSAAGILGGLSAASHVEQFAIDSVSITGAKQLSPETLAASTQEEISDDGFRFFSRENMFLYPRRSIEMALAREFPRIKKVAVSRESLLAQAVVVAVQEREPFARWCKEDACYVMDESGFLYAEAGDAPKTEYVFYGGLAPGEPIGQFFLRGRIRDSLELIQRLAQEGFAAEGITVDSEEDFTVHLKDGPELYVPFAMQEGDIIHNLDTALDAEGLRERLSELEYIDLRFGNRVYYR